VFSLVGDRILCDGAPYAEIVRRECMTKREARGEAYLLPAGYACRALAVRYADGSRVPLFAARSIDPWGVEDYNPQSKGEAIADWAYDIGFDGPSRRVTFRRAGLFTTTRWAYDVGTGTLLEVE
jgi:hypothetical protein